jgi:adenine-specific DNA methylase
LPKFALESPEFMVGYLKATRRSTKKQLERDLEAVQLRMFPTPDADLAWHVRAWGWWVLQRAKADLGRFYPVVDGKPTVAYLWARTVTCKNCRATVPLLKTRWLCKNDRKRVVLAMEPNADRTGVVFGVQADVPRAEGNMAQRREHDKRLGAGTMSRSGATCPCCGTIMTMEDIRAQGQTGRMGAVMTAVVVEGSKGKEYRNPAEGEVEHARDAGNLVDRIFELIPFALPTERIAEDAKRNTWCVAYGADQFSKLFTARQLLALGTFTKQSYAARESMRTEGYPPEWIAALGAYISCAIDRLADRGSTLCTWTIGRDNIRNTFVRFALPMTWDFVEGVSTMDTTGGFPGAIEWIADYIGHASAAAGRAHGVQVLAASATSLAWPQPFDLIVTDPPYYDAIGYSILMDFFYVWLRRTLHGLGQQVDAAFGEPLAPKWDHARGDGELIDDSSRFGGDAQKSKAAYEDGMFHAFQACCRALKPDGRMVVVFANKYAGAWETLVSALIRAGFVVNASWPIQTERGNRTRALASAALSSSVWLVCKKRPETAAAGWDNEVLEEMSANITECLRRFWDAGIRGPDFVWAATGPALEAYSKHPVVKKANEAGRVMTVSDFLGHVRRIVVDFVVGRVLSHNGDATSVHGLDDVTTYYLLHRHDFGFDDAPSGACILYALSCGLSDSALIDRFELLARTGGRAAEEEDEVEEHQADEADADGVGDETVGTGSLVRLKPWHQRQRKGMGYDTEAGSAPLIDQTHRLMHLWKDGDVVKVDEYLDERGLRHNQLFQQLLQALIELAKENSNERSLLESISNHVAARGVPRKKPPQMVPQRLV